MGAPPRIWSDKQAYASIVRMKLPTKVTETALMAFIKSYASCGDPLRAALDAGFAPNMAEVQADMLLSEPLTHRMISAYQRFLSEKKRITTKKVKQRLASVVSTTVKDFFTLDAVTQLPRPLHPHEWTNEQAAAVKKIKWTTKKNPFGEEEWSYDLELIDPVKSAKLALEHSLLDTDDSSTVTIDLDAIEALTEEQLTAEIRLLLS